MYRETWRDFNRRIAKEGRTEQFRALAERLLKEKKVASTVQAKRKAAQAFYPLDGAAHEFLFEEMPDGTVEIEPSRGRHSKKGGGNKTTVWVVDENQAALQPLIDKIDPRKIAGGHEAIQWVFDNMLVPWKALEQMAETIPGIGALAYLHWARSDPKNMTAFYQMWSKMLEKKSAQDEEARRRDDGRKTFSLLEDFERSLEEPEADSANA
jgi:hypothetical protein